MRPERKLKSRAGELRRRSLLRAGGRSVSGQASGRGPGRHPKLEQGRITSMRIEEELHRKLRFLAADRGETVSDLIRRVLREFAEKTPIPKG